jgi:hypothetical protein
MQSGAISSSTASLAEATARKPKASPQPSNHLSVVTLTSSESTAGGFLSPQAEASDLRSGKVSIAVMIISNPLIGGRAPAAGDMEDLTRDQADGFHEHHRIDDVSYLLGVRHVSRSFHPHRSSLNPASATLLTRIVIGVQIFEAQRTYSGHLADILTGFCPVEMRGIAGQNDDTAGWISL